MKFSDQIALWLKECGYTTYFFVGGGNIMHLTESLSRFLKPIPVIHEVAAGISAEYFTKLHPTEKALALVTAGPGLTNVITALSGAYLESRELLVIGGQVKTSDLASPELRSRGIQEIKGAELVRSTTKVSVRLDNPIGSNDFFALISQGWTPRKGPVFIEIPLDVQATNVEEHTLFCDKRVQLPKASCDQVEGCVSSYNRARRPILLMGGGLSFEFSQKLAKTLVEKKVPVMATYNGADLVDHKMPNFLGRPNTWGERSANIIIQNADFILALGTRLGLQQTGFNWQQFGREAEIHHVDIDRAELEKGHPHTDEKYCVDAESFLADFLNYELEAKEEWISWGQEVRETIPRIEDINITGADYISPYEFILQLEGLTVPNDVIVPCSSGSAFTLTMQLFRPIFGQRLITNKSLASMGYGLAGAIGACLAFNNKRRTILIEGDGGFAQNLQELGTLKKQNLNVKIFLFFDQGHASIRMTQQNYFNGRYIGCDEASGLGFPEWRKVFEAWDIPVHDVNRNFETSCEILDALNRIGPEAFIVHIDPKQTYYPKISSIVTETGSMMSSPIDQMSPQFEGVDALLVKRPN